MDLFLWPDALLDQRERTYMISALFSLILEVELIVRGRMQTFPRIGGSMEIFPRICGSAETFPRMGGEMSTRVK